MRKAFVLSLLALWVLSSTIDWFYEYGECQASKLGYKVTPYTQEEVNEP